MREKISWSDSHIPENALGGGKSKRRGLVAVLGMIRAGAAVRACEAVAEGGILRIEFCAQIKDEWSTVNLLESPRGRVFLNFGFFERVFPKDPQIKLTGLHYFEATAEPIAQIPCCRTS